MQGRMRTVVEEDVNPAPLIRKPNQIYYALTNFCYSKAEEEMQGRMRTVAEEDVAGEGRAAFDPTRYYTVT